MNDTKKLLIGATFGLFLGDVIVHIMNPAIPILPLVCSNILAIGFLVLYTNYKKRKYRQEELPDIDERVNTNIKKTCKRLICIRISVAYYLYCCK